MLNKQIKQFSKSLQKVLLLRDKLPLGFAGQIVNVKPGYAKNLFKQLDGVSFYNGLQQKVFPELDNQEIDKKLDILLEQKKFQLRIRNLQIQIEKPSSFTNPMFLKEALMMNTLIDELNNKLGMNLGSDNFEQNQDINKFGEYNLAVINYQAHVEDNKLFNFNIKVNVVNSEIDIDDLLK